MNRKLSLVARKNLNSVLTYLGSSFAIRNPTSEQAAPMVVSKQVLARRLLLPSTSKMEVQEVDAVPGMSATTTCIIHDVDTGLPPSLDMTHNIGGAFGVLPITIEKNILGKVHVG